MNRIPFGASDEKNFTQILELDYSQNAFWTKVKSIVPLEVQQNKSFSN